MLCFDCDYAAHCRTQTDTDALSIRSTFGSALLIQQAGCLSLPDATLQELELDSVQLADGLLSLGVDGAYTPCNGFTEPLRARVRAGGLLWVGGAPVMRGKEKSQSRDGLAAVLGGWGRVAAGRVLLAGDDLALLPLSEVRRQIVIVPREPLVVSGTVRHNLDLLGKAQGDWEIWAALEQCLFADAVRSWPGECRRLAIC